MLAKLFSFWNFAHGLDIEFLSSSSFLFSPPLTRKLCPTSLRR